jgi:hypothetical protein
LVDRKQRDGPGKRKEIEDVRAEIEIAHLNIAILRPYLLLYSIVTVTGKLYFRLPSISNKPFVHYYQEYIAFGAGKSLTMGIIR